jgi:hypothetical protein
MEKEKSIIPIIKQIIEYEEQKYGLEVDLETPTIMEYYKKNIKGDNFDLLHIINTIVIGLSASGLSQAEDNYICIFDRNKHNLIQKIRMPNIENILNSLVTCHEIRHILQNKKPELFSDYELFCIHQLKHLNNKYIVNEEYHDSQYLEIDANIYSFEETKKFFRKDPNIIKYLTANEAKHIYRKSIYNFENKLSVFLRENKNGFDKRIYNKSPYINRYWTEEGTFKRINEIIRTAPNDLLSSRILTSDAFLSNLNKVTIEEKDIIINQLDRLIKYLEANINTVNSLYNRRLISKHDYQMGTQYIEYEIDKKQNNSKVRILKKY